MVGHILICNGYGVRFLMKNLPSVPCGTPAYTAMDADGRSGGSRKARRQRPLTVTCRSYRDSVKATVAQLLTDGATLERGLQTILDEQGQRDMWLEIEVMEGITSIGWLNSPDCPTSCGLPRYPKNLAPMMKQVFEPMAQRIKSPSRPGFCKTKLTLSFASI